MSYSVSRWNLHLFITTGSLAFLSDLYTVCLGGISICLSPLALLLYILKDLHGVSVRSFLKFTYWYTVCLNEICMYICHWMPLKSLWLGGVWTRRPSCRFAYAGLRGKFWKWARSSSSASSSSSSSSAWWRTEAAPRPLHDWRQQGKNAHSCSGEHCGVAGISATKKVE